MAVPQELFDEIIKEIVRPSISDIERLVLIPSAARRDILAIRLVCKNFALCSEQLFIQILEQTAFNWTFKSLNKLQRLSSSKRFALRMTTLMFSVMPFSHAEAYRRILDEFYEPETARRLSTDLARWLPRLPNLKHVVYYACPPRSLPIGFVDNRERLCATKEHCESINQKELESQSTKKGIMAFILALNRAGIALESFKTPLFGNVAWWACLRSAFGLLSPSCFQGISDFQVNVDSVAHNSFTQNSLLVHMRNLKKLVLAISVSTHRLKHESQTLNFGIYPALKELRLMANTATYFDEIDLIRFIRYQPALDHVALGYIQLLVGTWTSFLRRLRARKLKTVWLINPTDVRVEVDYGSRRHYQDIFTVDESHQNVANDFRVLYAPNNWAESKLAWVGSCFVYTGWTPFEYDEYDGMEDYEQCNSWMIQHRNHRARNPRHRDWDEY